MSEQQKLDAEAAAEAAAAAEAVAAGQPEPDWPGRAKLRELERELHYMELAAEDQLAVRSDPEHARRMEQLRQQVLEAGINAGRLKLMDARHGYRYIQEEPAAPGGQPLIQPFDFDVPAVEALRARFTLAANDIAYHSMP